MFSDFAYFDCFQDFYSKQRESEPLQLSVKVWSGELAAIYNWCQSTVRELGGLSAFMTGPGTHLCSLVLVFVTTAIVPVKLSLLKHNWNSFPMFLVILKAVWPTLTCCMLNGLFACIWLPSCARSQQLWISLLSTWTLFPSFIFSVLWSFLSPCCTVWLGWSIGGGECGCDVVVRISQWRRGYASTGGGAGVRDNNGESYEIFSWRSCCCCLLKAIHCVYITTTCNQEPVNWLLQFIHNWID